MLHRMTTILKAFWVHWSVHPMAVHWTWLQEIRVRQQKKIRAGKGRGTSWRKEGRQNGSSMTDSVLNACPVVPERRSLASATASFDEKHGLDFGCCLVMPPGYARLAMLLSSLLNGQSTSITAQGVRPARAEAKAGGKEVVRTDPA